jgi:aminopeptidase N
MEHIGCCFLHVQVENNEMEGVQKDVLHEISHQWIGNFVGMSLKMKEGIVQYLEKVFAEQLFEKSKKKKRQGGLAPLKLSSKSNSNDLR